jgi:hypothetical protein
MTTLNGLSRRVQRNVMVIVGTAVILVCFWAFGGIGSANSTVVANQYGGKKVTICHKGHKTKRVSRAALPRHLAHGDTLGKCAKNKNHKQKKRKHKGNDG